MKFKKILSVVLAAAIASSAFSVTASAETQQITETVDKYQASGDSFVEGDFKYTELDDGTLLVRCNNKDITKSVIPSSVNGKKVTGIGDYAFYGCENLQSVTIPNSVTRIVEAAFNNCTNLKDIRTTSGISLQK